MAVKGLEDTQGLNDQIFEIRKTHKSLKHIKICSGILPSSICKCS